MTKTPIAPPPRRRRPAEDSAPAAPPGELDALIVDIDKNYGAGVIVRADRVPSSCHIPFGCFILDFATLGGYPEHCGHMVFGKENCGKSTLLLKQIASGQRKYPDKKAVWVDVEKKFNRDWARRHGVDLSRLHIICPANGEHAVNIIEGAAKAIEVFAVVLDSIPALLPDAIKEKAAEDKTMAERARLVGLLCSKIQQVWIDEQRRGHTVTFYCINQFREAIGQFSPHGVPTTLPGGRYQNYMVDTKLELRAKDRIEDVNGIKLTTYIEHAFRFTKSKGGFSIKSGEYEMVMEDTGRTDNLRTGAYDDYKTVATYAKRMGFMTGGGASWRVVCSDRVFRKVDDLISEMKEDPGLDLDLRRLCIMKRRLDNELTLFPPDGYLLAASTEEERERLADMLALAGDITLD